ncbi:SOS response-associated peptidase [uncultured Ferrovibrio sp.]|jgi:putative SOS response-associated peptidase YedK|uniref:SOS response-associated peptidase n=1 Tax=uncultured Ferrovibrio sp. TaxID=1576913 RepID=UPI0026315340|nr:SOS response-associated peptidase [uncultured Ferrovibrio sp.]
MCGRYSLTQPLDNLAQFFELYGQQQSNLPPRWNIAPTQQSAVIRQDAGGHRALVMLRWGFAGPNNAPLINARSETVTTKPTFAEAFRQRRCLVPADSFYEWQAIEGHKAKQPWRIGLKGGGLFAFAGLWQSEAAFGNAECFTILTTSANDYLRLLHDRMPVILPPEAFAAWLNPETPANDLIALLRPYPDEKMARYRVTTAVNSVKLDSPDCFAPLNPNLRRA